MAQLWGVLVSIITHRLTDSMSCPDHNDRHLLTGVCRTLSSTPCLIMAAAVLLPMDGLFSLPWRPAVPWLPGCGSAGLGPLAWVSH